MSVVSPLVLLVVGALVQFSGALECYRCLDESCAKSKSLKDARKTDCGANEVCAKLEARSVKLGDNEKLLRDVVLRYCAPAGTHSAKKCELRSVSDATYTNLKIKDGVGKECRCTKKLCNAAPQNGHLTVSFIGVVSLVAMTTARLLSQ